MNIRFYGSLARIFMSAFFNVSEMFFSFIVKRNLLSHRDSIMHDFALQTRTYAKVKRNEQQNKTIDKKSLFAAI